jgi:peptide/nickel transport system substrate-binding protein
LTRYDTFMLYRKENSMPVGEQSWSNLSRWWNDEFQAITDEMNNTAMDDPKMKDLFRRGMEIWYEELPDAPITQWYHRIPVNYHLLGQLAEPGKPVRQHRSLGSAPCTRWSST